jgi:putative transposase
MKLKHFDDEEGARFITFCTHRKYRILENDLLKRLVIDAIERARVKFAFRLLGYVLMPEHVHLVIFPRSMSKVGRIIGEIKRDSARRIMAKLRDINSPLLAELKIIRNRTEKYVVWQRRCYDHNCRKNESVWEIINYCHNNPVKRGLVDTPGQWPWSSYRNYYGMNDCMIDIDRIG